MTGPLSPHVGSHARITFGSDTAIMRVARIRRVTHGYEPTREAATAAFADNADLHFSLGKKLNNEPRRAEST
jgi:hypothetical protein